MPATILLINSTDIHLDNIHSTLSTHNWKLHSAPSIAEAHKQITKQQPDLLLIYSKSINKNHLSFFQQLKKGPHRHTPIIAIIEEHQNLDIAQLLQHQIADFIRWPEEKSILPARIQTQLSLTHTQEKLQRSEAFLHTLIETIPDYLFLKDPEGTYLACNPRFEKFFNATEEQILGHTDYDFVDKKVADFFREQDKQTLKKGTARINEEEITHSDGSLEIIETIKTPMLHSDGSLIGILGISRDITERKHAENILKNYNAELEKEIKKRTLELEKAYSIKRNFLANMSHEIRTPMNAIIGMSDLALSTPKSAHYEHLKTISQASNSLLGIINDLLDYSKIEDGKLELHPREFHMDEIMQTLSGSTTFSAATKELELIYDIDPNLPEILFGDPQRICQILINLTANAIKFTEKGEVVIRVRIHQQEDTQALLELCVKDTGIGIPQQKSKQIFQAFTQADNTITRKYGGTGLGLSISNQLASLMNGSLELTHSSPSGSLFTCTIPTQIKNQTRSCTPPSNSHETRILVVDNHPDSGQILTQTLRSMNFNAELSSDKAALKNRNIEYDLFILNGNPSIQEATNVAQKIAETHANKDYSARFIITTTQPQTEREAFNPQITFLQKPFTPKILLDKISKKDPQSNENKKTSQTFHHNLEGSHILLVEDSKLNQKVATQLLHKTGAKITLVQNGAEALNAVKENTFDLILMDIHMPIMDGISATREIRSLTCQIRNNTPILAFTAHGKEIHLKKYQQLGINDIINKPVSPNEFYDTIAKYLPSAPPQLT